MSLYNYIFTNFFTLTGGLNTVKSAISFTPEDARDIQNIDFFPIGGIQKRSGYAKLNSSALSANSCTGLYMARFSTSGGTNLALLVNDTKIYKMSGSLGGTWTDITGGLTITTGANNIWNFDILNDTVVLGNGTDTPIQVSSAGTATALSGGTIPFTKFQFPVQHRGYMWYFVPTVSGVTQYDRGYFSDINNPTTFTTLSSGANQYVNVGVGQGGIVTGAVDYKTYLYVFKRSGIFQVTYQPTRVNSSGETFPFTEFPNPVVPGVGTQSHRSIVKFTTPETHPTPGQELVFFIDQFGVPRIFDGTTTISFASKIAYSRDTTILSLSDMDRTRNPYSFSINYPSKNRILCFMSKTNSQQDTVWVLDYSTGFSISRYKFATTFNCGALFEKSTGDFKPYLGDYAGTVYETDSGTTDNGSAIVDYYVTGDVYNKSPSLKSKWYFCDLRGTTGSSTQNIKISYFLNSSDNPTFFDIKTLADAGTTWGSFIWGQANWSFKTMKNITSEINSESKTLRIRIESNNNLSDSYTMEGFSIASDILGTEQN